MVDPFWSEHENQGITPSRDGARQRRDEKNAHRAADADMVVPP
jgi:hypothetical protein